MSPEPGVVITGLALRLPGAETPEEFWTLLARGVDRTAPVSERRRELAFAPDWHDIIGEVADIDRFDAEFFGIEPEEAKYMDPQHRVVMEVAHDAMADAGLLEARATKARRYSVYLGMSTNAYYPLVCQHMAEHRDTGVHPRTIMNSFNMAAAARISHQYNLTGPVMAVDTACSSFLTALTQGIESIRHQGCDGAVIGGVNILSSEFTTMLCNCGGITTNHPFTRVFDEQADGTLIGEGAVVCILEREDIARQKNRRILGRIRGHAINNDGSSLNIMAPNPRGQAEVVRDCYAGSHGEDPIDHTRIRYIETHGTGTRIGDPIEINALGQVYRKEDFGDEKIGIGSVKSNIGHLLSAAGGASLAKLLLSLEHGAMAPNLHLETPNPLLELENTPFEVVTELRPWPRTATEPRMGAITSLGLGGTNVHVVVEEGEPAAAGPRLSAPVMCLSAKTERALAHQLDDLARVLERDDVDRYSLAMTLARFRNESPYRAVVRLDEGLREIVAVRAAYVERPVKRVLLREQPSSPAHAAHADRLSLLLVSKLLASDAEPQRAELGLTLAPGSPNADDAPRAELALDPALSDLELVAELFLRGCRIDWARCFPDGSGSILPLPPYPFDRQSHWLDH